jgi:hypothetical protein
MDEGVNCMIRSEKAVYKKGEPIQIHVEITNRTSETIYLIKALDASEYCWRYPYAYFTVKKSASPFYKAELNSRCGNMDGLPKSHIVKLEPGQSFNPEEKNNFYSSVSFLEANLKHRGKYKIRYRYSTNCSDPEQWYGDEAWLYKNFSLEEAETKKISEDHQKQIDQFAKVELTSNEIEIRIQ